MVVLTSCVPQAPRTACRAGRQRPACGELWPAVCCETRMSAVVYKVNRKSGDYIKAAVVPSNHSEESHFGLVEGVIVGFLLLCAGGLLCLLVLS